MNTETIAQVKKDHPHHWARIKACGLEDSQVAEVILRNLEEQAKNPPEVTLKSAAERAVRLFLRALQRINPLADIALAAIKAARAAGIDIGTVPELEGMPTGNGELAEMLRLAEEANATAATRITALEGQLATAIHTRLESVQAAEAIDKKRISELEAQIAAKDSRLEEIEQGHRERALELEAQIRELKANSSPVPNDAAAKKGKTGK
ncbi:MAG: hypothetical protein V4662_17705 [Verrucomicrobiota bacterium]